MSRRKYFLNELFFSEWCSDMAYVLGFWMADGYMRICRSYRICFYSKDLEILRQIKKVLITNSPIQNHIKKNYYELLVHSKNLYKDLQILGGKSCKSNTMDFPTVPSQFMPDYLRGYFDGDGSIHKISYKSSKNNNIYQEIRSNFTCGSKQFIEYVEKYLHQNLHLKKRAISKYGSHQYKLGYSQTDTAKLINYLYYPDCNLAMKRKKYFLTNNKPTTLPNISREG